MKALFPMVILLSMLSCGSDLDLNGSEKSRQGQEGNGQSPTCGSAALACLPSVSKLKITVKDVLPAKIALTVNEVVRINECAPQDRPWNVERTNTAATMQMEFELLDQTAVISLRLVDCQSGHVLFSDADVPYTRTTYRPKYHHYELTIKDLRN